MIETQIMNRKTAKDIYHDIANEKQKTSYVGKQNFKIVKELREK